MTTQPPDAFCRRQLLGSSVALAGWLASGCDRQQKPSPSSAATSPSSTVPLRVALVGEARDRETITRAWEAITNQPLDISLIALDRSSPDGIWNALRGQATQTDVVILPLLAVPQAVDQEFLVPLGGAEFEAADQSSGAILSAVKNGAARYGGDSYAIPLGAAQPWLLSTQEVDPVDSWQDYDSLVERWEGAASEPTAPGWAAAMFLWRSAAERDWLFGRDHLEPLVESESYVRSLQQMVQTCSRYQIKSQSPQQIWEGVASSKLSGGIGFPELRSELDGIVVISPLPGMTDSSRVLLDPFSPVIALASSCRQSAAAKRFILWISGGEGSQAVRRQVRGMTDTRALPDSAPSSGASRSDYDLLLRRRLSSPVTMPTLQLLAAGEYYGVLDRQVIQALDEKISPADALAQVAKEWQAITELIGEEKQSGVWRRAQGMRG